MKISRISFSIFGLVKVAILTCARNVNSLSEIFVIVIIRTRSRQWTVVSTPHPSPSSAAAHASLLQCCNLCALESIAQPARQSVRAALLLARGPDAEFDQALEWTVSQRDGGRQSVRRSEQRSRLTGASGSR